MTTKRRKPNRVETSLSYRDLRIPRSAALAGRAAMMAALYRDKAEMQRMIHTIEATDETLVRLDLAIAKAEAAVSEESA